jgi:hypothetical protein
MDNKLKELERLRARHTAKITNKLREANIPEIAIEAVAKEIGFFYLDVKDNILGNREYEQNKQ